MQAGTRHKPGPQVPLDENRARTPRGSRGRKARLGPADHHRSTNSRLAAGALGAFVEIADAGDHECALPLLVDRNVMGQAVALAARPVARSPASEIVPCPLKWAVAR